MALVSIEITCRVTICCVVLIFAVGSDPFSSAGCDVHLQLWNSSNILVPRTKSA